MGDQPVTRAEFECLHTAAKALLDQMVALTAKIGNINNNNRNYNDKNNQNRRCGPIRVRGRNNQIIEDSNFSMVEKTNFEEIMSNHWKKLQILREHATSAKSIEKDNKALKAKVDEDEIKPKGGDLRQQEGNLSTNNSEFPQTVKSEEVHRVVEDSTTKFNLELKSNIIVRNSCMDCNIQTETKPQIEEETDKAAIDIDDEYGNFFDSHDPQMEDILLEAERYGSKILVTDELLDGQMVEQWEPVSCDYVKTQLEVYDELQVVEYLVVNERVPITHGKSPKELDFDTLAKERESNQILPFVPSKGQFKLMNSLNKSETHWSKQEEESPCRILKLFGTDPPDLVPSSPPPLVPPWLVTEAAKQAIKIAASVFESNNLVDKIKFAVRDDIVNSHVFLLPFYVNPVQGDIIDDGTRRNRVERKVVSLPVYDKIEVHKTKIAQDSRLIPPNKLCRLRHQLYETMLFEELKPIVDVFTALVSVYGQSGLFCQAFSTIEDMKSVVDCKPDVYTYFVLISCYAKFRRFDLIERLLADMSYSGIECNSVTYNSIIDGYGKAGMFEQMENSLTDMIENKNCQPDVFTLNSLIGSYGNGGKIDEDVQIFALVLINSTIELSGDKIGNRPKLLRMVQYDLFHHLIYYGTWSSSFVLSMICNTVLNVYHFLRRLLCFQLEALFGHVLIRVANFRSTIQLQEVAVEWIINFCRQPTFIAEVYANYDCNPLCRNIFKEVGIGQQKNQWVFLPKSSGALILCVGYGIRPEVSIKESNRFTYSEIQLATNGFSKDNLIGEGEYCIVSPGTRKTKTASSLLFSLFKRRCRTLTGAPTNVAVLELTFLFIRLVMKSHDYLTYGVGGHLHTLNRSTLLENRRCNGIWSSTMQLPGTNTYLPRESINRAAITESSLKTIPAGISNGVFDVVPGFGATAGTGKVSFTGSTRREIMVSAARSNLKPASLELGGKSPLLIFYNADVDKAAKLALISIVFNKGEICVAGFRVFVQEGIYDEFEKKLVDKTRAWAVGDPFDPKVQQGPQVDKRQFKKIISYIEHGKKDVATLSTGSKKIGDKSYYNEPTIFSNVKEAMRTTQLVMELMKFNTIEEAIKSVNNKRYGLAAVTVTKNLDVASTVSRSIQTEVIWINCYFAFGNDILYGGYKMSGFGRDCGLVVDQVYTWSFMTSLDMEGLSISIMKADPSILQRLDAETKTPYWPVGVRGNRPPAKPPHHSRHIELKELHVDLVHFRSLYSDQRQDSPPVKHLHFTQWDPGGWSLFH